MALDTETAARAAGPPLAERITALRAELARRGLAAFIVPRADEHQGEYVAPRSERLAWLTGFDGSAGLAVIAAERAALFVDGRYTLQAREQVDTGAFEILHITDDPPARWAVDVLGSGDRLGFDPWLHTPNSLRELRAAANRAGFELVPVPDNPVDAVWPDQPGPPVAPVVVHELRFAGKSAADKRADVAAALKAERIDAAILTAPDSIAWLLNIRGADVPHTPVALAFAALFADGRVELFLDPRKIGSEVEAHLGDDVGVRPPDEFTSALDSLGAAGATVRADPATCAVFVFDRLEGAGAKLAPGPDPCALPKACKNEVELRGAFAAHLRDGAALTRFLGWLARAAPQGGVSEIGAAERLAAFRRENALFQGLSFPTISGAGPHGAVVHYRVTPETDRELRLGELYLVDSGAQYLDGTTDVTRTVFIGGDGERPDAEMRERFTRVLKGHIALATARFPKGVTGGHLDSFARRALWEAGLDYDHGTGHGVGSYLGVHEGPQRVAKMGSNVALRPGMIVSNEPGYYKAGAYGIRIENLVAVVEVGLPEHGERVLYGFDTITLAPIDRALIEPKLMTADEIAWLNSYHARVRDSLTSLVDAATADWLAQATRPLDAD